MARSVYPLGQLVRTTATFTVDGVATDPTTTTASIRKPDGTMLTYVAGVDSEITNPSTGVFAVDITGDLAGPWFVRFAGTGTAQTAVERMYLIDQSEVV